MNRKQRERWANYLKELYDEAKERHHKESLTIYTELHKLLNWLEYDERPDGAPNLDLEVACISTASKLRSI